MVTQLIDAAIHAPSAINAQPWAFVVIQERGLLARYAKDGQALLLGDSPTIQNEQDRSSGVDWLHGLASAADFALFHDAPTLVVIYAISAGGVSDCFLAAENLMLAAWSLGLGTCPIGLALPLFDRAEVRTELDVPSEWRPALPIVVGWPAGETPASARRPAVVAAWK